MTDFIEVPPHHAGRSVSISEERDLVIPRNYGYDQDSDGGDRKQSASSFLLPAVNLARRFSMKIAGNRDINPPRRRKRRAIRNQNKLVNNGRRKSIFEGRTSIAQLSIDVERGLIILKEEQPHPILNAFNLGLRRIRQMLGLQYTGVQSVEPPEPEQISLINLEPPHRYRPMGLKLLCTETGFSEQELKRLYRGFKNECPTGVVDEESFHNIYTHFFPRGEEVYHPNICSYSHYIFSLMDESNKGVITFEEFVLALSLLYNGTHDDRLEWTFRLYDLNGDGYLQKDELQDVALAVFDLMGKVDPSDQPSDELLERIADIFQLMDQNSDGVVSLDEFVTYLKSERALPSLELILNTGFII